MARKVIHIEQYIGGWGYNKEMLRLDLDGTEDTGALIEIASLGGSLFDAINMYNQISQHGNVEIVFVGPSASAATILAMGAKKISIAENSFVLIHKVMSVVDNFGTFNEEDLDKLIQDLQQLRTENQKFDLAIARIYSKRTGRTIEETIETMKTGTWLDAAEAKTLGLVDDIVDPQVRWNYYTTRFVAMVQGNNLPDLPRARVPENTKTENMKQFELLNRVLEVEGLQASDEGCYLNEEQLAMIEAQLASVTETEIRCNAALTEEQQHAAEITAKLEELTQAHDALVVDFAKSTETVAALDAQVNDLTNQTRSLQDSLSASESQLAETFRALDTIDETVSASEGIDAKVALINTLLSKVPGAPTPGILREKNTIKSNGVNWDVINSLPHNREADKMK